MTFLTVCEANKIQKIRGEGAREEEKMSKYQN